MRLRTALCCLALVGLGPLVAPAEEAAGCAPGMFLCPKEASCIPMDWVGDGEQDCEDGADESRAPPRTAQPKRDKNKTQNKSAMTSDPFADSAQAAQDAEQPAAPAEARTTAAPPDDATCTDNHQAATQACVENLDAWVGDLALTNFSLTSVFNDELTLAKVEQGCALLQELASCMDGLPADCQPESKAIRDFQQTQMYACELLIPSLKEHHACFEKSRNSACAVPAPPANHNVICRLVSSVHSDIHCVSQIKPKDCDDVAVELFEPMRQETHHVLEDLKCSEASPEESVPEPAPVQEAKANVEQPTATPVRVEFEKTALPTTEAVTVPTEAPTTIEPPASTTTKAALRPGVPHPSLPDDQDAADGPIIEEPTENEKSMSSIEARPHRVEPKKERKPNDLSDTLFAFGNVDQVCADQTEDIWTPIRRRVCSRKEDLTPHANCFLETAIHNNECQPPKTIKKTACEALEAFNKNVDCVIVGLNDHCPVEAQDVVIAIQEGLNDEAISLKCYEERDKAQREREDVVGIESGDGFVLKPVNPRCSGEQENAALVCLVELVEINKKLAQFQNINFLMEVSNEDSPLMNEVCSLYNKYDKCLNESVFAKGNGQRCSFNSPLNTLARIGLSPICTSDYRKLLIQSRSCLSKVSAHPEAAQCQTGLQHLGQSVGMMIQGIHGEALLCKSFYSLRDAFNCGEEMVRRNCDAKTVEELGNLMTLTTSLGVEEGCPAEQPADLNEIISRPVQPQPAPSASSQVPTAKAMTPPTPASSCEPAEQSKFGECVKPLTTFKPHPLAVVTQPKDIELACEAHKNFLKCREPLECFPLWAKGMSAMFAYACGEGAERYAKVKGCVRKVTTRNDVRDCVTTFSRSAPQQACESTNRLLACALPVITEKCGNDAKVFVSEYVRRFANTVDANCKVGAKVSDDARAIHTYNCTTNEQQIVEHCSAPLNDISARLDDLFQGGLQSLLKNLNNLAPVFAQGCNLTTEFRACAKPILERNGPCTVSSCLIRAGNGICNQPDVADAIDSNLGCIFKQVNDPEFGKCLRTTIATLKDINLAALRGVLPRFVECVEPIVVDKCGIVPVNVLKALGSREICPIGAIPEPLLEAAPETSTPAVCTNERRAAFEACVKPIADKYPLRPIAIVGEKITGDEVCADSDAYQKCHDQDGVCEEPGQQSALRSFLSQLCSAKQPLAQHQQCLRGVSASGRGAECLKNAALNDCTSMNKAVACVAQPVNEECGADALQFAFNALNDYVKVAKPDQPCQLQLPSVSLQTGCSESDLIAYLECETFVDAFKFRPITFISNFSQWDEFCRVVENKYRPCLDKLPCRFEPVSTASITLFENLCEREITRRDQRKFAECLAEVADAEPGRQCLEPYKSVDLLAKEAAARVCQVVDRVLDCASGAITQRCGDDALLHVYDIHGTWVHVFNQTCTLQPTDFRQQSTPHPKDVSTAKTKALEPSPEPAPESTPEPQPEPTKPVSASNPLFASVSSTIALAFVGFALL